MVNWFTTLQAHNTSVHAKSFIRLLTCSISLVLTFLLVANFAKALTLDGAFEFYMKLATTKGVVIGETKL